MKKVMILGAGVYQVPLIRKAKDQGYRVLVVSPAGKYPGFKYADDIINLDTRDSVGVLKHAKQAGIDAVLTTGTDVAVPTIGYIADALGLPGTGYEAAQRSMDKALMKQCFADHGIRTAKFAVVSTLEELKDKSKEFGLPVMVKAIDSSGSRGVRQVISVDDLEDAFNEARAVSNSSKVILEEYIVGNEIGADTLIVGGEPVEVFLHEKIVTPPPVSVPIGHSMPLRLSEDVLDKTKILLKKSAMALGLSDTISNADVMIVDGEPFIIEMSARMGGTCIPEVISASTGFDIYGSALDLALGNPVRLNWGEGRACLAKILMPRKKGFINYYKDSPYIKNREDWCSVSFDYEIGDSVREFRVGPDRVGQIIVSSDTIEECYNLMARVEESLNVEVCG